MGKDERLQRTILKKLIILENRKRQVNNIVKELKEEKDNLRKDIQLYTFSFIQEDIKDDIYVLVEKYNKLKNDKNNSNRSNRSDCEL